MACVDDAPRRRPRLLFRAMNKCVWLAVTSVGADCDDNAAREYAHHGPIVENVSGRVEYGPADPAAGTG